MNRFGLGVALSALALVTVTSAYAADVEVVPDAIADWTGFHIGAGGGGNFVFSQQSSEAFIHENCDLCDVLDFDASSDLGKAGAFGTIEGGADYQMDSMVFGVLANYDFGKTSLDSSASNVQDGFGEDVDTELSTNLEVGDSWAAGARFGLLPTERTLLYVLGGYTEANISQDANVNGTNGVIGPFDESVSGSGWESGYFVGAGIETMFTDNMTMKLEYRFADYGEVGISREELLSINNPDDSTAGVGQSDDITVHSIRAVLSYRFLTAATSASAADVNVVPDAIADWTGLHIGAGGGGNFVFSQQSSEAFIHENCDLCDVLDFDASSDLGKAGAFGTIEGGADYQMDSMVFGVLANYDFGKTSLDSSASNVQDGFGEDVDTELSTNLEVGDSWAAGARFGLLPTERTLLYVLGGYTEANISQDANVNGTNGVIGPFDESVSGSGWESGYFVGAGIETMFTDNMTMKLEYRFADYGEVGINREEIVPVPNQNDSTAGVGQSDDVTVHSIRAVLSYRF